MDMDHLFAQCHSSASSCATLVRDQLGPTGFLKYTPDSHFVQTSYAVLTLLKLIRPESSAYLDNEQSTIALIKDVADVLESNSVNSTPPLFTAPSASHQVHLQDTDTIHTLNVFQFKGEMGHVADVSTFLPTMAPDPMEDSASGSGDDDG
ncbi:hypothetical protein C8R42DRAFT_714934 [Lentinula raphanica]|nr:hypothetical protein C8R42DRAFT_714934 [Lentinula raphanica]